MFSSYLKGSRLFWTMRVKLSPAGYGFDIMKLTLSPKLFSKTDNLIKESAADINSQIITAHYVWS